MAVRKRLLSSSLEDFGTTIFARMSVLATETGAINLGQGFPDVDGPRLILESAMAAIGSGRGNQYPPLLGVPELRAAIAGHHASRYGLHHDPDTEVMVTAGATEAIAATLFALLEPGDEVIAFEPYYDSYTACISMAGGRRVPLRLNPPDFSVDIDRLRDLVTDKTRMLLINNPHNPTGMVLSREELLAIAEIAQAKDLLVVMDEVYEHLTYDGATHIPMASIPGMAERTITIGSAGKTFSLTGWKIGWVTAKPDLVAAVRTAKQFLTYVPNGPFQYAVADALNELPDSYYTDFQADLARKRDLLGAGLKKAGFEVFDTQGTIFLVTDIQSLGESDGMAFCLGLPERCGVVAIPLQVFYDDPASASTLVRFAFCKRDHILEEAISRLSTLS